ncbi:uncharacterized protein KY384_008186 [Bacidia gigantensis]|uniref:uncharacterized protein n=1 Tax=Bacidia gigantensis TaxID=2732470 RepID=UPI001D041E7E|nr:uncharacterized protein KY384_008186 [Bacidia gigantensis]KAG8526757.1 hypothetical protein KY384_008186 [Bacidia gigantensis]
MNDPETNEAQDSTGCRRRSMLPQLSQRKPPSRIPSPTKAASAAVKQNDTRRPAKHESISLTRQHSTAAKAKSSMPPPPAPGRLRSSTNTSTTSAATRPSTTASSRRPSTTKSTVPGSNHSLPPARKRTSSVSRTPSAASRVPSHNRSTSHQIPSTSRPTAPLNSQDVSYARRASLRLKKPTFAAYQQHYTPSKSTTRKPALPNAKPPSTASDPSTPDSDPVKTTKSSSSPPLTAAQTHELLYLHLLHSSAIPTLSSWQDSAKSHFSSRFVELQARHVELAAIEKEQQGLLNAIALAEWGSGVPSAVVGERVASLSRNVAELEGMIGEEGRFERVRGVWEVWYEGAERVRGGRGMVGEQGIGEDGGRAEMDFVEGIGDGWKAEAMVLERELGYVEREMVGFEEVRKGSGLWRLVGEGRKLVRGLLEELDVMQWIEDAVMREEEAWVDEMVGELGRGLGDGMKI